MSMVFDVFAGFALGPCGGFSVTGVDTGVAVGVAAGVASAEFSGSVKPPNVLVDAIELPGILVFVADELPELLSVSSDSMLAVIALSSELTVELLPSSEAPAVSY